MGRPLPPNTFSPLIEYRNTQNEDVYLYTSNPDQEDLSWFTRIGEVGYVCDAVATPIYRYFYRQSADPDRPLHTYTTFPEEPARWSQEGIKFYAFAVWVQGAISLTR
jgi:hypothetical protein